MTNRIISIKFKWTNRSLKEELSNNCKYLIGDCEEEWDSLFLLMSSGRTRSSRHKLKYKVFNLNIKKNIFFFYGLPREAVEFTSLDIFKILLEMVLRNTLWAEGWDWALSRGPFLPQLFWFPKSPSNFSFQTTTLFLSADYALKQKNRKNYRYTILIQA